MSSLRTRNLILWSGLGLLLWAACFLVVDQQPWSLQLDIRTAERSQAQLFFDRGNWFRESDSHTLHVRPEAAITEESGESWQHLHFRFRAREIYGLRFDPLTGPGEFQLRNVRLARDRGDKSFSLPLTLWDPEHQIETLSVSENRGEYRTTEGADDPWFIWIGDTRVFSYPIWIPLLESLITAIALLALLGIVVHWNRRQNQRGESVSSPSPGAATILFSLLFGVATACQLFGHIYSSPTTPWAVDVDVGWMVVLDHAWSQPWQFGRDIWYNYGPLGFLHGANFTPETQSVRLAWAFSYGIFCALTLTLLLIRLDSPLKWLVAVWFLFTLDFTQSIMLVLLAGPLLTLIGRGRPDRLLPIYLWLWLPHLIVISLIKFTYLGGAVLSLGTVLVLLLMDRRWKLTAAMTAGGALGGIGLWIACGQNPLLLPAWIQGSLEISRGYTHTMTTDASNLSLHLAYAGLIILALLFLASLWKTRGLHRQILVLLLFSTLTWISFKHGFVRGGDSHVYSYFHYLPLLAGLVLSGSALRSLPSPVRLICMVAVLATVFISLRQMHQDQMIVKRLVEWPQRYVYSERVLSSGLAGNYPGVINKSLMPLPEIVERVGQEPVDYFHNDTMVVLTNGLNYSPRPVFQSYAAHTPWLEQKNLKHLLSPKRSTYAIYRLQHMDDWWPSLEDSPAILSLWTNYLPILQEEDHLLLKDLNPGEPIPAPEFELLAEIELSWGERLDLTEWKSHPTLLIETDFTITPTHRLQTFLYKPEAVRIRANFEDKSWEDRRWLPIIATDPVLVSPFLRNTSDVDAMLSGTGENTMRPVSIQFLTHQSPDPFYQPVIQVRLFTLATPFPKVEKEQVTDLPEDE